MMREQGGRSHINVGTQQSATTRHGHTEDHRYQGQVGSSPPASLQEYQSDKGVPTEEEQCSPDAEPGYNLWFTLVRCMWLLFALSLIAGVAAQSVGLGYSTTMQPTVPAFSKGVHLFFYSWYGPSEKEKSHWDHTILPHWNEETRKKYPHGMRFNPANKDIGSACFPERGMYDSTNPCVLDAQMKEIKDAGTDVLVVSWWGRPDMPGTHDGEGVVTDHHVPAILAAAEKAGVKIAFHLEPYKGKIYLCM